MTSYGESPPVDNDFSPELLLLVFIKVTKKKKAKFRDFFESQWEGTQEPCGDDYLKVLLLEG